MNVDIAEREVTEPAAQPLAASDLTPDAGARSGRRRPVTTAIVIGVLVVVGAFAWWLSSARATETPAPQSTAETRTELLADLVNRGLIPARALEPSLRDQILMDQVNRGFVPRQALD